MKSAIKGFAKHFFPKGFCESKKAFVISFDALVALFVVFSFLVASFALLARADEPSFSSVSLKKFSFDVLSVLERSGRLDSAVVSEDSSELNSFLNYLPYYYCARLEVFEPGSEQPLVAAARDNCRNPSPNAFTARRFFFVRHDNVPFYYVVELKAWQSGTE